MCALPSALGLTSQYYLATTTVLGGWFTLRAVAFLRAAPREPAARKLFLASIIWLPLQLAALVEEAAERTAHRREHDVVHGAAERAPDATQVVERDVDRLQAAPGADAVVDRESGRDQRPVA